jgi:hypothetical protein
LLNLFDCRVRVLPKYMTCNTLAKLKNEYDEAEAAFDLKHTQLQNRMGSSQKHEYDCLNSECERLGRRFSKRVRASTSTFASTAARESFNIGP